MTVPVYDPMHKQKLGYIIYLEIDQILHGMQVKQTVVHVTNKYCDLQTLKT